jgi:type III pantothenate kinase
VRNGYREHSTLGADRWAALIAARHLVAGAALAVMAGTAPTIDALTQDGQFLGGLILPGFDLMAESLARGTAGLPRTPGGFALFPQSTADAIASGAIQALCGAVERMQRALAARGAEPQILLSGGAAETLYAHLGRPARIVPNLVLEGLRVIAESEGGQ